VYFGVRSDRELRKGESSWPGCPGHPGHGSRLVIMEYQDAGEVPSHDTRGTGALKVFGKTFCNTNV